MKSKSPQGTVKIIEILYVIVKHVCSRGDFSNNFEYFLQNDILTHSIYVEFVSHLNSVPLPSSLAVFLKEELHLLLCFDELFHA